jgi:hypothetical protein
MNPMKKLIFSLLVLLVAIGCKKEPEKPVTAPTATAKPDDTQPPVIRLNGRQADTCILHSFYNDPGVTAADNKDGDVTFRVVTSSSVNINVAGTYFIDYYVRDGAGNTGFARRSVHVMNQIEFMNGTYLVACNCVTTGVVPQTSATTQYTSSFQASFIDNFQFSLGPVSIGTGTMVNTTNGNVDLGNESMFINLDQPGSIVYSPQCILGAGVFTISTVASLSGSQTISYLCTNVFTKQK